MITSDGPETACVKNVGAIIPKNRGRRATFLLRRSISGHPGEGLQGTQAPISCRAQG
jgi:hypothetical protein